MFLFFPGTQRTEASPGVAGPPPRKHYTYFNVGRSKAYYDYNRFISSEKIEMEKTAIGHVVLDEANEEAKAVIEAFLKNVPGIDQYRLIFK